MTTANITIKEMGNMLAAADRVLLFPHINPDPDAIGSCVALCRALRQQGKTARVLLDAPLPRYLKFLASSEEEAAQILTTDASAMEDPDICMCMDCSEEKRIEERMEIFRTGKTSLCLDHHRVEECWCDHYYIDPEATATAQLVFDMMREMDWPMDEEIATALYTGIDGDTGCFMHSNTTAQIHRIAADLQDLGVDANTINVNLYQSKSVPSIRVNAKALQAMEVFADGRAVISKMTAEDFRACGAQVDHADTVIDELRCVEGVEIAAFLKEDGDKIRCNLRSKTTADVAAIARKFGGGGHIKASGFRSEKPMEEVFAKLRESILEALE